MLNFSSKPLVPQSTYASGRSVAVWIGNFVTEEDLDDYINIKRGFSADYGFQLNDGDMPEVSAETEEKGIRELLTGFSLYEQFIEEAVLVADAKKIKSASCAIVFHFLVYPEKAIRKETNMRYLGSFSVDGFK